MEDKIIYNYINGELMKPVSGKYIDVFNPATGNVYAQLPDSDALDIEQVVEAAENAFPSWSTLTVEKRSAVLLNIASAIEANLDQLALAESIDNGKPLKLAKTVDIPRAASNFHFFAT